MLEAALEYLEAGFRPIPCLPRDKRPVFEWREYQDRAPSVEEVTRWWTQMPEANIALALHGGQVVIDVDGPEGLNALPNLGTGPQVITGKGRHFYFYSDALVQNKTRILPEVDVRAKGGYVIAPPSVHPNGSIYQWSVPLGAGVPKLPPGIIGATPQSPPQAAAIDWLSQALLGVEEGGRDATCARLAGYLLGKGLPEDAVTTILIDWAARCDPPFDASHVAHTVHNIALRDGPPGSPPCSLADAVDTTMAAILTPADKRPHPVASGLAALDSLLAGGFYPGEYVILGARPAVGKTALALQISQDHAVAGGGVLVVTREMTREAVTRRMLCQASMVRAEHLKTGELNDMELTMLHRAADKLRGYRLWIEPSAHTAEQIADVVKSFNPGVLSLVVVDYLQLLGTTRSDRDNQRARIEATSKGLRALALDANLTVMAISSLSRPDAGRANWRPTLASLRESGELEHDADVVLLMHRDEGENITEINLAKARDGQVGKLDVTFDGPTLTFRGKEGVVCH